jgi:hypothetical protein
MRSIAVATEDELSEQVAVRLTSDAGLEIAMTLRKNGNGYLRGSIEKFANMSLNQPLLLITDLDTLKSPQHLILQWMKKKPVPPGLLFHVAVREVEAWLLADHLGMKHLLGGKIGKLPSAPELLPDPKASLLAFAAKAPREIRSDLVAERNSMAAQGLGYNARLGSFVRTVWKPNQAAELSPSLAALRADLTALSKKN